MDVGNQQRLRMAELIATLSLATDLGMGQPMEQALRTCLLSMSLGQQMGLPDDTLADTYYLALLRFVGCTADAHEQSISAGGDEITYYAGLAPVVMGEPSEILGYHLRHFAADHPPLTRMRLLGAALAAGTRDATRTIAVHCEVARMLAERMGLRPAIAEGVGHVFERWDGKGLPGTLAGDAIPMAVRVVVVARDVDLFNRAGGWDFVTERLRRRRGRAYDPALVDAVLADGADWVAGIADGPTWESVLAAEPGNPITVAEARLETVLNVFADVADIKSPFTIGHSRGVAELAGQAARIRGLGEPEAIVLRRAALVHDLGRVAVPNGVWERPGPLTTADWERVRLHAYYSERMLSRMAPLQRLAVLAGAHHERLDGSGYHRGSPAAHLAPGQRILAAADSYQAMTQQRPHRAALTPPDAAAELRREVASGRLDRDAVDAVLEAAGFARVPSRRSWPAGLTDREVDVLRLICRGFSNRQIAAELSISPKTVGRHVENLYNKIGVSSRAAAALFAIQHGLLDN
ncbi:MAG TPA: HD domain-containing phosphohydrolase [Thermomicrobiales bacterium]|nr:HD domain-containing phosphohydrolase [Thermomicrobiales bacterium]